MHALVLFRLDVLQLALFLHDPLHVVLIPEEELVGWVASDELYGEEYAARDEDAHVGPHGAVGIGGLQTQDAPEDEGAHQVEAEKREQDLQDISRSVDIEGFIVLDALLEVTEVSVDLSQLLNVLLVHTCFRSFNYFYSRCISYV